MRRRSEHLIVRLEVCEIVQSMFGGRMYRMPIAFTILILALTGLSWAGDGASGTDDEIASVKAFNQAYTNAQKTADVNAIASLWAPDAIMMPAGEPAVVGSRQIHAWLTRNQPDANVVISNDVSNWKDITVTGDYAFQWAQTFVNIRSRTGDAGVHMSGTALQVLKKQPDGSWKLYRSSWSYEPRKKDKTSQ
jgi:ketosteroid isomerase-like protein